jgi:membrane protein
LTKRTIADRILASRLVTSSFKWAKTHSLPGLGGIPLYSILDFIFAELRKDNIIIRANAMAFSFFIALFPSIIVIITLLPYLPIQNLVETVNDSILQLLPAQASSYVIDVIDSLTTITNRGLLSFGLFLTLFFASNGMLTMLRGFQKNYTISYRPRSGIYQRLIALKLTFIVGGIFIASMLFIVVGRVVLDTLLIWARIDQSNYDLLLILRWFAMVILFYAGISVTYRYGPSMKKRIQFLSPGATLATILSIISSIAFSYYVNKFSKYNELYGSLGALIVLMLWMQINSLIILIGYELNASIRGNQDLVELEAPDEGRD